MLVGLVACWWMSRQQQGGTVPTKSIADRIKGLVPRANQKLAKDWHPILVRAGAHPDLALGLTRWIGIESSGRPLAVSKLGERGLLQISPATAKLALTDKEWAALANTHTTPEEHARIAIKQFAFHAKKALGLDYVKRPPVDALWWAKVHHAWPADLKRTALRPDAKLAATVAGQNITTDRERLRLAASNVVAFGTPDPSVVPISASK